MNNFINLVKINFRSAMATSTKTQSKYSKYLTPLVFLVLFFCSIMYSNMICNILKETGKTDFSLLIIFGTLFSCLFLVILFISSCSNIIYKSKDNELLLSMPIKKSSIVLSKLSALLLLGYLYESVLLLPFAIMYFIYSTISFASIFSFIIGFILLPIVPIILSTILSAIFNLITRKIKHKQLFALIGLFIFFGLFMYLYMGIDYSSILNESSKLNAFFVFLPNINFFIISVVNGNFFYLLYNFLLSSAVGVLGSWFLFATYFKIANIKDITYKAKITYKANSVMNCLIKKEAKRYLSSSIYVFNTFFGIILMFGFTIYLCIDKQIFVMLNTFISVSKIDIALIFALICCFFVSTCVISSVSISIERKYLENLKSMPLSCSKIVWSKVIFNFIVVAPFSVIAAIIFSIVYQFSIVEILICVFLPLLYGFISAMFGAFVNLMFPNLTTQSDAILVKQTLSSFLAMLSPVILFALSFGAYFKFLINVISFEYFVLIFVGIISLFGIFLTYYIMAKSSKKIRNMSV